MFTKKAGHNARPFFVHVLYNTLRVITGFVPVISIM